MCNLWLSGMSNGSIGKSVWRKNSTMMTIIGSWYTFCETRRGRRKCGIPLCPGMVGMQSSLVNDHGMHYREQPLLSFRPSGALRLPSPCPSAHRSYHRPLALEPCLRDTYVSVGALASLIAVLCENRLGCIPWWPRQMRAARCIRPPLPSALTLFSRRYVHGKLWCRRKGRGRRSRGDFYHGTVRLHRSSTGRGLSFEPRYVTTPRKRIRDDNRGSSEVYINRALVIILLPV